MKKKPLWLSIPIILFALVSVIVAFTGNHYAYSNQTVTEVELCGGGYVPASTAGGVCLGVGPNKVDTVKLFNSDSAGAHIETIGAICFFVAVALEALLLIFVITKRIMHGKKKTESS